MHLSRAQCAIYNPLARQSWAVTGGTYTLLVDNPEPASIVVGALGTHEFIAGTYAYTGSAFGPGGFTRIERHRALARGDCTTRHWHVDFLLGHAGTRIVDDVRSPEAAIECDVADRLPDAGIAGFGASDCACPTHLAYSTDRDHLRSLVRRAHNHL